MQLFPDTIKLNNNKKQSQFFNKVTNMNKVIPFLNDLNNLHDFKI